MGKNGFLQRQKLRDDAYKLAASDTERQFLVDMLCLVLHDPAVMGRRRAFGKVRVVRVVKALSAEYDRWKDALTNSNEADYLQTKLDEQLQAILQDEFSPFPERYFWLRPAETVKRKSKR